VSSHRYTHYPTLQHRLEIGKNSVPARQCDRYNSAYGEFAKAGNPKYATLSIRLPLIPTYIELLPRSYAHILCEFLKLFRKNRCHTPQDCFVSMLSGKWHARQRICAFSLDSRREYTYGGTINHLNILRRHPALRFDSLVSGTGRNAATTGARPLSKQTVFVRMASSRSNVRSRSLTERTRGETKSLQPLSSKPIPRFSQ